MKTCAMRISRVEEKNVRLVSCRANGRQGQKSPQESTCTNYEFRRWRIAACSCTHCKIDSCKRPTGFRVWRQRTRRLIPRPFPLLPIPPHGKLQTPASRYRMPQLCLLGAFIPKQQTHRTKTSESCFTVAVHLSRQSLFFVVRCVMAGQATQKCCGPQLIMLFFLF